jgi:V/A-type H+/Na+-transporting ATPase subunit E
VIIMEAKEVIDKILSEAQSEADEIMDEGRKKADEYKKATQEQLDDFDNQSEQLAAKAAEDKKQRILAAMRMKNRKDVLSSKQDVLAKVFDNAREKLLGMDRQSFRSLFKTLICSAVQTGEEEIIAGRSEDVLDGSLIDEINSDPDFEKASGLSFSGQKGDFDRGVVVRRGDVRTNISVEVLLQMARENLETEIATELFTR